MYVLLLIIAFLQKKKKKTLLLTFLELLLNLETQEKVSYPLRIRVFISKK